MFVLFMQTRDSVEESWKEAYDPEPYNIYDNRKMAEDYKKILEKESKGNSLVRFFIRQVSQREAELYV